MPRSEPLFAWLLTYALHSTLLLGIAWALTRRLVQSHGARDLIWKTALIGGLVSSSVQMIAGITPVGGRFALRAEADGRTGGWADDQTDSRRADGSLGPDVGLSGPGRAAHPGFLAARSGGRTGGPAR